jgi:hypothetical protein
MIYSTPENATEVLIVPEITVPIPPEWQLLAALDRPELLDIPLDDAAQAAFGCDQDWYGEHWQRQAGCGPCTSATILYYLALSRPDLSALYTLPAGSQEQFRAFMDQIWQYVTPGRMGVNEAGMLVDGVVRYAGTRAIGLASAIFCIPGLTSSRQPLESFRDFIVSGLSRQTPVAFLNLSNGKLDNLDSWHWVTVTALFGDPQGQLFAELSDSGEKKRVNLSLWYRTTRLGGAAVYFLPEMEQPG